MELLSDIYNWLKLNDIPNWLVAVFSLVIWPIALFLWSQRTINNIPNLEVSLSKGKTKVGDKEGEAVYLNFLNNTGSIVYFTNARILNCSKLFQVDLMTSRDIAKSSHELKFPNKTNNYLTERQIILQTDTEVGTCLLLKSLVNETMLSYRPNLFRKLFRWPKFFCLEYTAMVGNKRYKVSTIY